MPTTNFVANTTAIAATWLNEIDEHAFEKKHGIYIADTAAVGDGTTDDYAIIRAAHTAAVLAGVPLVFEANTTYAMDTAQWAIDTYSVIQTNGCVFKSLTTSTGNSAWIDVGANVTIDWLNVLIPTGIRRDRAIRAWNDNTRINRITLNSTDVQLTSETDDGGVLITAGSDSWFGLIEVTNYDKACTIANTSRCFIGKINITGYVRGVYAYDNTDFLWAGGLFKTRSTNASNAAGHNGLLMQSNTANAQKNVTISDLIVEDAGEHAIRIGGAEQHLNIRLIRPTCYNAGNCGIKVLGTDTSAPTSRNQNIIIDDPIIEDCGTSGSTATNRAGILLQFADFVVVNNPIVKTRALSVSAAYGILIDACKEVIINSPICYNATFDGIFVYAWNGDNERVQIRGGISKDNGRHGLNVQADATRTLRRVDVDGLLCETNLDLGARILVSGTAVDCRVRVKAYSNTNGIGSCNSSAFTLHLDGVPGTTVLSGITANNGSTASDGTSFNYRKAGAWVAL